jgi:two-component system NtrC family sensor kinase
VRGRRIINRNPEKIRHRKTPKAERSTTSKTARAKSSVADLHKQLERQARELEEARQQQAASSEVLHIISASPGALTPVFKAIVESAVDLCGARFGAVFRMEGDLLHLVTDYNFGATQRQLLGAMYPMVPNRGHISGRAVLSGSAVQIPDIYADEDYKSVEAKKAGFRSLLAVPLLQSGRAIGSIVIYRTEPGAFTARQLALLQTFADQAVIAIENARLFDELQARTKELAASLDDLRIAQDRLIQTEKLASLGQLTAGIAHEIKNPLNFVNNFSALSAELIDELDETLAPAPLDQKMRGDVGELTQMLKSNLEKVVQHGKRADSIVKNMLLHSREGEHRSADINALVEESLNLAYHGARAEKPGFNVMLKRDLDPDAGAVELYPQEITRALLNLISNGFYAATQRKLAAGETFEPVLIAATKNRGKTVEIRIRDNGTGIPDEVKEKIFNPFFTTKPSGEGTGLGLSMSHDIIVKQHGGSIDVETEPGLFTEFKIVLPRTNQR